VVLGLGVIVLIHELGHFLVAKAAGMEVERFSIGFPPHVLKMRRGGTEYCLGAIPLGGYVKVDLGTGGGTAPDVSPWKRMLVVLAGPGSNLLLTAALFFLVLGVTGRNVSLLPAVASSGEGALGLARGDTLLSVNGDPVGSYTEAFTALSESASGTITVGAAGGRTTREYSLDPAEAPGFMPLIPPVVGEAPVGLPAHTAGLRGGDSLTAVDGREVGSWDEMVQSVRESGGGEIVLSYVRDGAADSVALSPVENQGVYRVGLLPATRQRVERLPLPHAVLAGMELAVRGAAEYYSTLFRLFARPRELYQSSGGPVYVAQTLSQQASYGLARLLETVAIISLAVMVFNLLPIPILDGGQLIFLLFEAFRGRPLPKRTIQVAQQVGLFVIMLLFVVILQKDISRLLPG
jgi:regulator of sigma E protease